MKNQPPIVTLMTDFGTDDVYVGVMKGVIAAIAPRARAIDLTHAIPPFAVVQAAFRLKQAYPYFPEGTIHVTVVDPGVGSSRRAVAMESDGHVFIAPDNGLLSPIEREHGRTQLVALTNDAFFRKPVSATFHGRDIFAPVAAHIANGVALSELGPPLDALELLACPRAVLGDNGIVRGEVLWADRFGNLVTNIPGTLLSGRRVVAVRVGDKTIDGLSATFTDVAEGALLATIGSFGMLEIALRRGSAAGELAAGPGTVVQARPEKGTV